MAVDYQIVDLIELRFEMPSLSELKFWSPEKIGWRSDHNSTTHVNIQARVELTFSCCTKRDFGLASPRRSNCMLDYYAIAFLVEDLSECGELKR